MSDNLQNYNNLFSALAQSTYKGRPASFAWEELNEADRKLLLEGESLEFDFSKSVELGSQFTTGGVNLPNNGVVYLQPDLSVKKIPKDLADLAIDHYKGDLTDSLAGFNTYFLTDTLTLSPETSKTYFAVRGSDAAGLATLNDWVDNNYRFLIGDAHIPQAKLAHEGMRAKLAEVQQYAPNATMDVTAHSLGTMISVQSLATLPDEDFARIGEVHLFHGPDTTKSLEKMGISQERLEELDRKIHYYVNPFDMVSMLNRNGDFEGQLGTVHIIVPLYYTSAFDSTHSAHDFGTLQIQEGQNGKAGVILEARQDFHPELLVAGQKLAQLQYDTIQKLKKAGYTDSLITTFLLTVSTFGASATFAYEEYKVYQKEYQKIIDEAKRQGLEWGRKNLPHYQERLRSGGLSSSETISLRSELLYSAALLANLEIANAEEQLGSTIRAARERIITSVQQARDHFATIAPYLSYHDFLYFDGQFQLEQYWSTGEEERTLKEGKQFRKSIEQFSQTLAVAIEELTAVDARGAEGFEQLMRKTQSSWRY